MVKHAQGRGVSQIYPLISAKERLAVWEKARGAWKRRSPEPIRELNKMRTEWSKKPSL